MIVGLDILINLALSTAVLIAIIHITGRKFGIDFGPLKSGVSKVMFFLLLTSVLSHYMGLAAIFPNLLIWTVGFKIAFRLDWNELMIFIFSYLVAITLLRIALVWLIIVLKG